MKLVLLNIVEKYRKSGRRPGRNRLLYKMQKMNKSRNNSLFYEAELIRNTKGQKGKVELLSIILNTHVWGFQTNKLCPNWTYRK